MAEIVFRGSNAEMEALLGLLPAVLAGQVHDPTGLVEGVFLRMGTQALSLVQDAFMTKAQGGTDEAGEQWAPLSPQTIAYKRRHPKLQRRRAYARKKGRASRPLLSAKEDALWRKTYAATLRRLRAGNEPNAEARAAAFAWKVVKRAGGKTILGEYGQTKVEILRDTGLLGDSLSPGTGEAPSHPDQVLHHEPGAVIVGTNIPYAKAHHEGIPGRLIARRLWPEMYQWPDSWWGRIRDSFTNGIEQVLRGMLS